MDVADIRRLASAGVAAFPPAKLEDAAAWLRDYGVATGDARYFALSDLVSDLAQPFAGGRGVPVGVVASADELLSSALPDVLDHADAALASTLARQLHADLVALFRD